MPDKLDVENLDAELTKGLKRLSAYVARATLVGDFVFIFFKSEPKKNVAHFKDAIMDFLLEKTENRYSFFKSDRNQWVFRQEAL
jgi:glycyl-tRNA synthetase alpha subunit